MLGSEPGLILVLGVCFNRTIEGAPVDRYLPTVVVYHIFPQFFAQLAENAFFVEKFTLVPMLEVFSNSLSHIARQLPVRHVLFHLLDLQEARHFGRGGRIGVSKLVHHICTIPAGGHGTYLFAILTSTRVQTLDEIGSVPKE